MTKVVLDATQDMPLKVALQMARYDYEDRRERQSQGIALAKAAGKYKGRPIDHVKRDRIKQCLSR